MDIQRLDFKKQYGICGTQVANNRNVGENNIQKSEDQIYFGKNVSPKSEDQIYFGQNTGENKIQKNEDSIYFGQNTGENKIQKNEDPIYFGQNPIGEIARPTEAEKINGLNKFSDMNLGFMDRLDRMDVNNKLNHPTHASSVEGYDNGIAKYIDFIA